MSEGSVIPDGRWRGEQMRDSSSVSLFCNKSTNVFCSQGKKTEI
jgi:hypothetical protein